MKSLDDKDEFEKCCCNQECRDDWPMGVPTSCQCTVCHGPNWPLGRKRGEE